MTLNYPSSTLRMRANNIGHQSFWATIGFLAEEVMRIVPVILVARHSDITHLCALGIGNAFLLIVIQSFTYGFASGLNTLVAYAFNDQQFYTVGLHLNRALIVNT